MSNDIDYDGLIAFCLSIRDGNVYSEQIRKLIEVLRAAKEQQEAQGFDVLELKKRVEHMLAECNWNHDSLEHHVSHGKRWGKASINNQVSLLKSIESIRDLLHPEPAIETKLEDGKWYWCETNKGTIPLMWNVEPGDTGWMTYDGAFYCRPEIKPILISGKPVPLEVPKGD